MNIAIYDNCKQFGESLCRKLAQEFKSRQIACQSILFHKTTHLLSTNWTTVQALFLCVDIPAEDGIEIARVIRSKNPHLPLILISKDLQSAPKGYHLNAFRYLLKHQIDDELSQCIDDLMTIMSAPEKITVSLGDHHSTEITLNDIFYCEGTTRRKVRFHTKNGVVECPGKLASFDLILREKGFLRIQRSFLVNMTYIQTIRNYWTILVSGERLKTSVQKYSDIQSAYRNWKK